MSDQEKSTPQLPAEKQERSPELQNNMILREKLQEAAASVLPITVIVLLLSLFCIPIDNGLLMSFLIGSVLLTAGMAFFGLGADLSMSRIGTLIGARMTQSRSLPLILAVSFLLGAAVTIAEPDLQVLATVVPEIDATVLLITVSVGVGIFLMLCMLRIFFRIPLRTLLIISYGIVFISVFFMSPSLLSVAFDSGGVTTGPMTVPFIMALGVGVASMRSDENAKSDSFGLVALCSIGPILSVVFLSFIFSADGGEGSAETVIRELSDSVALGRDFLRAFPEYFGEVAVALLPVFLFFLLFQLFSLKLRKRPLIRIFIGIGYTYFGLVLFLTGVNVGFSPLGYVLGMEMAQGSRIILLPLLAAVMGWFIINAEPAVRILNKQVEELSAGAISGKAMGLSLSIAVAAGTGLAFVKVISRLSILYFVIPGYAVALLLSFFVPPTFTAIAFDSGGVASGPLTAAFMLPMAIGACSASGGEIMTDAFGLVALVAMMPLITVQVMGVIYVVKSRRTPAAEIPVMPVAEEIIELWEVC